MKRIACLLSIALPITVLGGCVHGDNLEKVQAGMTREQVASLMGPPDASTHSPGKDCAYYTVLKDFWSRTPWTLSNRYYVCFTDGRVETFGRADLPDTAQMTGR